MITSKNYLAEHATIVRYAQHVCELMAWDMSRDAIAWHAHCAWNGLDMSRDEWIDATMRDIVDAREARAA